MYGYRFNTDARNIVDRIQKQYQCCGRTAWLDWALDESKPTTVTITGKSIRSVGAAITSLEDITTLLDNYSSKLSSRAHDIDRREINHIGRLLPPFTLMSRQKRQTISTNSITYGVTINDQFSTPRSCCSVLIKNSDGTVQASKKCS
ncbi:unnamed protein product [Rotaria sordida]|uniref:Uncharacterized protein n=1 Tax=Rotaria sordida TaxID=392033 RepID=A0A819YN13_9BILA|nr:unnamed protein product [Rotaria sordida]